jgi:hypothetical protein
MSINSQDTKEIVQKATDLIMGKTNIGESKMTIIRPDWSREVTMKSWSKGIDYYLIIITAPARDKGQVFLKREIEMWNWMPSISRMIKIPPSMLMQSWMGSDFTNDDLLKESDEDEELINIQNSSNIRKIGGRTIPTKMTMIPVNKEGNETILEFINAQFDTPISDNFFSQQNMKRVR